MNDYDDDFDDEFDDEFDDDDYSDDDGDEVVYPSRFDPMAEVERLLDQSRRAKEQGDLKRALYLDHWALQGLLFKVKDFKRAYDLAIQTALDGRRPIHNDQMERVCVYEDLILTYIGIDPIGHAELIESALQHMEQQVSRSMQCFYCLLEVRATFQLSCAKLDEATTAVQTYYSESEHNFPHHFGVAQAKICELMYLHQNWEKLLYFGEQGERVLGADPTKTEYSAIVIAAQALALRKLGRDTDSSTAYRKAVTRASRVAGSMDHAYYNFLCDFHVAAGDLQAAISLRNRQLEDMANKGQPYWEATARLHLARLMKQRSDSIDGEVEKIRHLTADLRKPQIITEALNSLLAD